MSYCDPSDLSQYLPQTVINLATSGQQQLACDDASTVADSYLRGRYELPLLDWGRDVRTYTAWVACSLLADMIGYAPQAGADRIIKDRYYQAIGDPRVPGSGWFPGIQRQAIHPDVTPTVPSPGNPTYDLPQVRTSQARGWGQTCNGKPVV